jgi:hypothetical protein
MKKLYILLLLILPSILALTAASLWYTQGPYWISNNSDPEYLYLLNSLAMTQSEQTGTTGNPGTTLQMLGAAVLKITHSLDLSEKDNLEFAVLKNPEFYLTVINIVLVAFNVLMLFILGLITFHVTKNIWLSLLLQFSPFLSNTLLTDSLPRVSPESLLLCTGLLFVLILIKMAHDKNLPESANRYTIILALVSGFGVATKLTFIPLLIIPLLIFPKLRNKIGFLILTGLGFILWTWPVISQYKILIGWYYKILTHTGFYGFGNPGILDTGIYLRNIINMLLLNPLFFLILVFSIGFILISGLSFAGKDKPGRKNPWHDIFFRLLVAVTLAQLFAVAIAAKHFIGRYLLPVMSLTGFMIFLIFVYLRQLDCFKRVSIKKIYMLAGVIILMGFSWRIADIKSLITWHMQIRNEAFAINQILDNEYKDYLKIRVYRCSSPVCALAFGNFYVNNGLFSESLQKIYGDVYFFNELNSGANGNFHTWTSGLSEDNVLKENGSKIIFQGSPLRYLGDTLVCKTGSIVHLKDILGGEYETIYALAGYAVTKAEEQHSPVLKTMDFDFSSHPRR